MEDLSSTTQRQWLDSAIAGDPAALGRLLVAHRAYLCILARAQIHQRLQSKVDASDVVQEVSMVAQKQLATFRGTSPAEFAGWLRGILANLMARQFRHHLGTQGRDVRLEQTLHQELDHASAWMERRFIDDGESPSQILMRRESFLELADALEELPDDYRTAILLRNMEGLPFAEIATRMQRSVGSVEKLWMRGLAALRQRLGP